MSSIGKAALQYAFQLVNIHFHLYSKLKKINLKIWRLETLLSMITQTASCKTHGVSARDRKCCNQLPAWHRCPVKSVTLPPSVAQFMITDMWVVIIKDVWCSVSLTVRADRWSIASLWCHSSAQVTVRALLCLKHTRWAFLQVLRLWCFWSESLCVWRMTYIWSTKGRPGKTDWEQIVMMSLSLRLEILTFPVFDLLSQDHAAWASPASVYERCLL